MNPDGSGTWTRYDRAATRLKTLYGSGPKAFEVHLRETFDANTGELVNVTHDFASSRDPCPPLVPEEPRSLKTVFHFRRTSVVIPPDATTSKTSEAA